jgi:hypothetical protein
LDDLAMAERLFRIAKEIDRSPQLDTKLAAVTAEISRRAENKQRRPVVTANVEQPAIVRPMLAAPKRGSL